MTLSASTEEKRNVLKRVSREVFGEGNMASADELISPDFVDHDPLPGMPANREGFKVVVQMFRSAFPDFEVDLMHTIVEGDKVVDHMASRGTHLGEFMGIPATGKRISTSAIVISRLDDECQIGERWQRFGAMQLLQQIGVVPGWEEPPPVPPMPSVEGGRETSVEENKADHARQLAIWNDGDYDVADEIFHPEAICPTRHSCPSGPEG